MYTNEFLNELLTCVKRVTSGWREIKDNRSGIKKVLYLQAIQESYEFSAFYTQNRFFTEDFSIGLVYISKTEEGKLLLIRCNGSHGPTTAWGHHAYTHTHKPTVEGLNIGNKEPTEIERIDEYTTLEGGLHYFGKLINIIPDDKQKHFPAPVFNIIQTNLFGGLDLLK